jgi:hypothetical protein
MSMPRRGAKINIPNLLKRMVILEGQPIKNVYQTIEKRLKLWRIRPIAISG